MDLAIDGRIAEVGGRIRPKAEMQAGSVEATLRRGMHLGRVQIQHRLGGAAMFCANCGGQSIAGASFCGRCGASMNPTGELMPSNLRPQAAPVMAYAQTGIPPLVVTAGPPYDESQTPARLNSAGIAAWILLVFACAGSLIPGLGFGMWLIISPILLITLVLGVMAISNGRTASGVVIILMSLIVVPLFVIVAPFASTVIAVGAAASSANALSTPDTPPADSATQDAAVAPPVPATGILSMPIAGTSEDAREARQPATSDTQAQPESSDNYPKPQQSSLALPAGHSEVQVSTEQPTKTARISSSVSYAVLRTQPTMFSKGLGRLVPGTEVTLGAVVPNSDWVAASTTDGRSGFISRREIESR